MKGITDISAVRTDVTVTLSRDQLIEAYWASHPRYIFFKSVPENCRFLEIGASNGGLSFWKDWRIPLRNDIKMFGLDLTRGEFADRYERFDIANLNTDKLDFEDNSIDAIYSTHVFEHLENLAHVTSELGRVLTEGGIMYIETPNQNSVATLSRETFMRYGFKASTMNFYDDKTHIHPYNYTQLSNLFLNGQFDTKFELVASGTISNSFLAEQLISYGFANKDQEITTYGLWLLAEWSDYIVLRKKSRSENISVEPCDDFQQLTKRLSAFRGEDSFTGKFKSRAEYEEFCVSHAESFKKDSEMLALAKIRFGNEKENFLYRGFCTACNCAVDFWTDANPHTSLNEGMVCPTCWQNGRQRIMYNAVKNFYRSGMRVYVSEYVTGFFKKIQEFIPDVIGSEFLAENDERRKIIRHEDVTNLSFEDSELDMYISNDVFEHVFDYKKAFAEAFRVLKLGGRFIFHVPFHANADNTVIRAKMEDGKILHLKEPCYHGDPVNPEGGCLCINDFGWDILQDLRGAGFMNVFVTLDHDTTQGFMGNNALFFTAEK